MKRFIARLLVVLMLFTSLCSNGLAEDCNHKWEFEYDPKSNYEYVDENYHKIVSTTLYYYCTGCDETRIKTEEASSQYLSSHYFDSNNVCVSCGHIYVPIQTAVPTVIPTQVPLVTEEPVHICVADKPVHWIGVYNQYDEAKHSQHHVIEIKCKECGTLLERSNTDDANKAIGDLANKIYQLKEVKKWNKKTI